MQLDLFETVEEDNELKSIEDAYGTPFPGSPGWTEKMEIERLSLIEDIKQDSLVDLYYIGGKMSRCHWEGVFIDQKTYLHSIRLLTGAITDVDKLREMGILEIAFRYPDLRPNVCLKKDCDCSYQHIEKLRDVRMVIKSRIAP